MEGCVPQQHNKSASIVCHMVGNLPVMRTFVLVTGHQKTAHSSETKATQILHSHSTSPPLPDAYSGHADRGVALMESGTFNL